MAAPLAPIAPATPILGHLPAMRRDPLSMMTDIMANHGPLVRLRMGPNLKFHVATHPDIVQGVLQTHAKNFDKQTHGFKKLQLVVGQGLLTSDGDFWRRQRRIAQPAFHKKRLAGFADSMVRAAVDLAERLERAAQREQVVDVDRAMMQVTLDIVAETLLSASVGGIDLDALGADIDFLVVDLRRRIAIPLNIPLGLPLPKNVRFKSALEAVDKVVVDIIERRRRGGERHDDLLQMLFDAEDEETGERMNDAQLRDEAVTMFLAGHETTASALSWTMYLLSLNPDVRRKARAECEAVLQGRVPTLEDLPKLVYLTQVLEESMRLYPPAWMFARHVVEETPLADYTVPAGSTILVSTFAIHRRPEFWVNPLGFDPDRFAPEARKAQHKFQFLPFGAGQRKCIGAGFAMMEAKLIMATLLPRFELDLVPGQVVTPQPAVTLRPLDLRMRVTPV